MESDTALGVESNLNEALEAAHEGLAAFFALVRIHPSQADVWCANNTRAYDQAVSLHMSQSYVEVSDWLDTGRNRDDPLR